MSELISNTPLTSSPRFSLETMDDEALRKLIADGYKLLDRRKREREKKIKEQIKELAAAEGIKVSFSEPSTRRKKTSNSE